MQTDMKTAEGSDPGSTLQELVFTRDLPAPRELVWQLWTDPKHMAQWWGPHSYTCTACELDVKPGGRMYVVIRGEDGRDGPMEGEFEVVEPPGRLVFVGQVDGPDGKPMLRVRNTLTLAAHKNGTTLTLRLDVLLATGDADFAVAGMQQGWSEALERLHTSTEDAVAGRSGVRDMVVRRLIDAPRELVWEVWSTPEHVAKWWGPDGFRNTFSAFDLRPGGHWTFVMHGPDGTDYPNHIAFEQVQPPERLVYAHGEGPDDPAQFRTTITLMPMGGQTLVTLRAVFPTAAERDRVLREVGAVEGGRQTLRKLAEYVATQRKG